MLQIGNDTAPTTTGEKVRIPDEMLIPYKNNIESFDYLINAVLGDIYNSLINSFQVINRAILTSKNSFVDEINVYYVFDPVFMVSGLAGKDL